ncbi:DUF4129 domain-containing protein [Gryllotalpicola protaetiae]|uniref:DUF4129 domain-containing protein n=1 Tax=Gryllotalpicola protaetiae TaxID=2419771 RepID=A0A387BVL3_9MICO|nr:DUF4129 domain-containing protein [Gryllotalpicola protaetiae]AYG04887.1 DUF4129 domain-containing protein [Gryllotalpicola protaetiae]
MLGAVLFAAVAFARGLHFGGPIWNPGLFGTEPPPAVTSAPTLPPEQHPDHAQTSPLAPIVLGVVVAAAAVLVGWLVVRVLLRLWATRTAQPVIGAVADDEPPLAPDESAEPEAEPDAPIVHRGLRLALDELAGDREPADAVVRAWLGLQAAAEDSGVERRAAETPTEFTTRVITRVQADGAAAAQLVEVYQSVRFGAHEITSAEVRRARAAIEKLLDSWHEPVLRARR